MPAWKDKFYVIEHVGVEYHKRYLKELGHQYIMNDPWDQPARDPKFGPYENAFRWSTYQSACHWLARWNLPGTYRVIWVDLDNDVFEWADGPREPDSFGERDWKEFHEWNGKSN